MISFVDRVEAFVRDRRLLEPGEHVLAAVSGGADSMALAHVLLALRPRLEIRLTATCIDHGLRPSSGEEAEQVVKWLSDLGLRTERVRLPDLGPGPSLENRARDARRDILEAVAARHGCEKIATAHQAEDAAESLLLHLLRGTGLAGLKGMSPRNGVYVRPLLRESRGEILAYLQERGISHLVDPTNYSLEHTRNRIRHLLVPLLEESFNPEIVASLNRLGEHAATMQDFMDTLVDDILARPAGKEVSPVSALDLTSWGTYHKALKYHALRRFMERQGDSCRELTSVHYQAILELIDDPHGTGKAIHLPGGRRVRRRYNELLLESSSNPSGRAFEDGQHRAGDEAGVNRPPAKERMIALPGITPLPGTDRAVRAEILPSEAIEGLRSKPESACFSWNQVEPPLQARRVRHGDRMIPHGMKGHKKLSDIFVDRKIPRETRSSLWIFEDGRGIIWIPGIATAESTRVSSQTRRVLRLELVST